MIAKVIGATRIITRFVEDNEEISYKDVWRPTIGSMLVPVKACRYPKYLLSLRIKTSLDEIGNRAAKRQREAMR